MSNKVVNKACQESLLHIAMFQDDSAHRHSDCLTSVNLTLRNCRKSGFSAVRDSIQVPPAYCLSILVSDSRRWKRDVALNWRPLFLA
jgi:hypothetical protein